MKKLALALLLFGSVARAQTPPTNVYGENYFANNAMAVSAANQASIRYNSVTNQFEQSLSGAAYVPLGSSLQAAYTAGSGAFPTIQLDATRGGISIQDTPGGLFSVFQVVDATATFNIVRFATNITAFTANPSNGKGFNWNVLGATAATGTFTQAYQLFVGSDSHNLLDVGIVSGDAGTQLQGYAANAATGGFQFKSNGIFVTVGGATTGNLNPSTNGTQIMGFTNQRWLAAAIQTVHAGTAAGINVFGETADGAGNIHTAVGAGVNVTNTGNVLLDIRKGLSAGSTSIWSFTLVQMNLPANTIFSEGTQSATNTTSVQWNPNVADGASSVAFDINNQTSFGTNGAHLFRVRNNGVSSFDVMFNSSGNVVTGGGGTYVRFGGYLALFGSASGVLPGDNTGGSFSDNVQTLGLSGDRWQATYSYWSDNKVGAQLTAASTITPTSAIHHVTGATTINVIALTNVPTSANVFITLIADTGITFGSSAAAGGIKTAPAGLSSGKAMVFALDQATSLWYPVQGG